MQQLALTPLEHRSFVPEHLWPSKTPAIFETPHAATPIWARPRARRRQPTSCPAPPHLPPSASLSVNPGPPRVPRAHRHPFLSLPRTHRRRRRRGHRSAWPTMGLRRGVALGAAVLAAVLASAAAGFISNDALLEHGHDGAGRSLLQAKKDCPVSFEGANYTIITSRCKGPLYQPTLCCNALKDFACPYSTYINDVTTTCAATMFSYINLYGKYPPGLFANNCHEGDKGLTCPEDTPQVQPGQKASGAAAVAAPAAAAMAAALLAVSFLVSW